MKGMTYEQRVRHRSRIIAGQIEGLQKMIGADAYCMDILTQNLAIQRAVASLNKLVIEHHIETHIKADMESGDASRQDRAVRELAELYELHNIKGK